MGSKSSAEGMTTAGSLGRQDRIPELMSLQKPEDWAERESLRAAWWGRLHQAGEGRRDREDQHWKSAVAKRGRSRCSVLCLRVNSSFSFLSHMDLVAPLCERKENFT